MKRAKYINKKDRPENWPNDAIETEYRVDIRERIVDGLTEFFTDQDAAKAHAEERRSYPYPCYTAGRLVGYAVPK